MFSHTHTQTPHTIHYSHTQNRHSSRHTEEKADSTTIFLLINVQLNCGDPSLAALKYSFLYRMDPEIALIVVPQQVVFIANARFAWKLI